MIIACKEVEKMVTLAVQNQNVVSIKKFIENFKVNYIDSPSYNSKRGGLNALNTIV